MKIREVMLSLHPSWRYRWCGAEAGPCACMGCVNFALRAAGYTKEDWLQWVKDNPNCVEWYDPPEPEPPKKVLDPNRLPK